MITAQTYDWHLLRHAYGDASDVPALLQKIVGFPDESDWQFEPWFSLWSALYHQGDIYSASIAAVPEIVSTLFRDPSKATLSFYLLPASIATADNASPVDVPGAIRADFTEAVAVLGDIAVTMLSSAADEHMAEAMTAAALVSQGDFQKACELLEKDD
jgi:hypothetical protein